MKAKEVLLEISMMYKGNWEKQYEHIKCHKDLKRNNKEIEESCKEFKEKFIDLTDDNYPTIIKNSCQMPPFVIYYRGNIELLTDAKLKRIAVIGSRNSSHYGEFATDKIVKGLAKEIIIISGGARGIDTIGIKAAIASEKKVIVVLGTAIDSYYPSENSDLFNEVIKQGGLIISEYPPGTDFDSNNFRLRNRLIAAICDGLFVGEAYLKSGTKITVRYALDYNKNVGCLPYKAFEKSYCNQLIKEGACLIEDSEDLFNLVN